ncbi:hypothetical protein SUGI_0704150 [Cryptomeria japonica]|nr:hypothetical protein SUGI_0704050 [Cryptomeria japonica]GLJ34984.1 hypothetical protein SUGI_0704080 [Cryptomeria japonica]GLJ34990.1 hypothetical protein SUGI_0704150 [Cryptomeria japonica]
MNNMKFKEGCMVEVCRSDGGIFQCWFRDRIISSDSEYYLVEYDNLLNDHGKRYVEDVQADVIRPEPPHISCFGRVKDGCIMSR